MPENLGYQFDRLYAAPIETYRQVNTITNRNAIPPEIRWEGMECYVVTENQDYQLVGGVDNSNWVNAGETVSNPTTHFKGFFNATTVTPAISNLNGIEGDEYKVTNGGVNVDFGAGDVFLETDDILIFYQSQWRVKVRPGSGGTDAVTSVFGRIGDVVANSGDYSAFYSPIITGGGSTIVTSNLTANRALLSNASGKVAVSTVTNTELGYVNGVTSPIQTQLNAKLATSSYTAADVLTKIKTVDGSGSGLDADLLRGVHWGNVNTPIVSTSDITGRDFFSSRDGIGIVEIVGISSGCVIGTDTDHDLILRRNNTERARLTSAGFSINGALTCNSAASFTGTATATNFILSSDERLKSNIKPIGDIWREFEMDGVKRYGVVAQEIEKTNPELVYENEEGYKSVAYIDLLCKEMAEKDKQIKDLNKRLEDMGKLISRLIK